MTANATIVIRYLRRHINSQILISLPIINPFNLRKDKTNNLKTYRFCFKTSLSIPYYLSLFLCTFASKAKIEKIPDMENYIVSARKYRPSTFESVVGQRALTTTLKKCNCYSETCSCVFILRTAG